MLSYMCLVCIFLLGGRDGDNYRDEILELMDGEWRQVATMKMARISHAVTIINVEDYWIFCK